MTMLRRFRFAAAKFAIAGLLFSSSASAADLKGTFVLDGDAPAPAPVTDPKAEGDFPGQKLVVENFVVDPATKGIANIAVYVRTAGVAVTPEATAAAEAKVVVDNKNGQFQPHITGLWVGKQKLVFKNSDPAAHNSNFAHAGENPLLAPNAEVPVNVATPALIPKEVSCSIHPWMKGFIVCRDSPYVTSTGKDGSFTLKNLPTGTELEIQFWQEKSGYLEAKSEWPKGRMKITLTGDQDLGVIKVDPKLFDK
jgi:plastocyanin